jgi:hypothetical protein
MTEPYVVLHGGFHKTASTYLQRILQRNSGFMRKRGVYYVHHREMRKNFTIPCHLNGAYNLGVGRKVKVDDASLCQTTEEFFMPISESNPERLILSDENLVGHCGHCVRFGRLYELRKPFLGAISKQIPYPVKEIHLSVRNYADFFSAAYVEYMRSMQAQSGTRQVVFQDRMVNKVINKLSSWNAVINQIKASFPEARLYIWTFEDFRKNPMLATQILGNIAGPAINVSKFRSPKDQNPRPTASQRAVDEIQKLMLSDGVQAAVDARRSIQEQYPRNIHYPGFDPWSAWERQHLTRLYEKDVARLAADSRITMVRPDTVFTQ